jgi:hypothetical protein
MARGAHQAWQATLGLGKVRAILCQGAQCIQEGRLRRTGIDVEVRQVKHFDAIPTWFLWRRQWIRFWFGKPASYVQRGRRWKRTGRRDEVLAYQLKQREYGQEQFVVKHRMQWFQSHYTHLAFIPRNVRISHYLCKHRAQRRSAECAVAAAGELELLT